ncbi:MAG: hypothetical protein IH884_05530, partial [Myxococcales bacterium]|nr:hypothetical protein [Myxococcales bacterium]
AEDPREYKGLQVDAFSNDLAQAIAVSRVAVSIHSAALLACVANGRLGIAFVPPMLSQSKNIVIIELEPFGLVVRDPAGLAELVGRIRRGELTFDHVRTLQQAWARCLDGQAAARIADRVCGLLEHGEVVSRHADLPDRGPCMTSAGDRAHDGQSARTVLLIVNARSHFLELVTIGFLLRDERGWDPIFCFVGSYGGAEDDQQRCAGEGIPWVTFASATPRPSWQLRFVRAALRVIEMFADVVRILMTPFYLTARWLYRSLSTGQARPLGHGIGRAIRAIGRLAFALRSALGRARKRLYEGGLKGLVPRFILNRSLLLQLTRKKVELACARRLMARIQPKLVILAEDNVESAAPAVIKMAHEHGAKAAILPYTLATAAEPAESYWDSPAHQLKGLANRVVGWLYPSWVHEHRGRRLIRLPAGGVLAMQMTGLSPPQPWQFCSGGADAILVENRAIKDYFGNAGLPRERIKVTGSPILDRLACDLGRGPELRRDLLQRLGMPQDRRIVVCALPPDQLDLRAGVCEFQQYEALVRFWIGTLRDNAEANLILSLHPRTPLETVQPLTGNRVAIVPGGAAGLIPLCDLFVASVSATIRWAIACGKPVLNYDVYRYGYDDYTSAEGVITLQDADEFAGQYHRLMHEPEYFEQIRDRQAACAAEWGELDGQASKRLLAAFSQLAGDEGAAVAAAPRPLVASTGVGS